MKLPLVGALVAGACKLANVQLFEDDGMSVFRSAWDGLHFYYREPDEADFIRFEGDALYFQNATPASIAAHIVQSREPKKNPR
jgi:hypothetical protein